MPGTFKYRPGTRPMSEEIRRDDVEFKDNNNKKRRNKSDSRNKRPRVRDGNVRVSLNSGLHYQHPAVRPSDQSVLSMDSVLWSDKHYTVPQLVLEYSSRLPLLVKVTRGYHDDTTDISVNEVLLVQNYARQKRINVVTSDNKEMSIPADSPLNIVVRENAVPQRIGTCCDLCPIDVMISEPKELLSDSSTLKLRSVMYETYLRSSKIIDGWIDQISIFEVPSLFSIEFAIAEGISGASNSDWSDYKSMYEYSVRHIRFDTKGYQDIFIYGETRRISLLKPHSVFDRPTAALEGGLTRQDEGDVVFSLDVSARPLSGGELTVDVADHDGVAAATGHGPLTPCSDVTSNGDLEEMFNDVIEIANNSLDVKHEAEVHAHEDSPLLEGKSRNNNKILQHSGIDNSGFTSSQIAIVKPQQVPDSANSNDDEDKVFISLRAAMKHSSVEATESERVGGVSGGGAASGGGTVMTRGHRFQSGSDIPSDETEVANFSAGDMQRCFELIRVKDHRNLGRVDGAELSRLTEKRLLGAEFRMTPFDASKIMRFARGWRP